MPTNYRQWSFDLRRAAKGLSEEAAKQFQDRVALRALDLVVDRSPVGNPELWKSDPPPGYVGGHFRGNWFVTVGPAGNETREGVDPDGMRTRAEGRAVIAAAPPFSQITIYNAVPYAMSLEHGHSTQAPQGVVTVTVAEIQAHFGT